MPNRNYLHFSAEDFASDTYFQKWVLENDLLTNLFWEAWLVDNPEKKVDIDLAKKLISQFSFKEYAATTEEFNEVWKNIKETHIEKEKFIESPKRKWHIATISAVAILILSISVFCKWSSSSNKEDINIASPINNDIQIGTDKAILTLADGSNIKLAKGEEYKTKNASSNGKKIVYTAKSINNEIVYNYLTTPLGGQFYVKLSDGTQVWLNSESQLKYPVTFIENKTRQVELVYGEAYFDVSPSTAHNGAKFKVINQAQEVEVLGTEFNIKAYKNEFNLYTTLVEGKVSVDIMNRKETLIPNQQLILNRENNKTIISKVDVYREISWKEGVFSFKNKPLKDIMKVLSRWYDIDVVFQTEKLEAVIFNGTLNKKLSIYDILETITNSDKIDYEIDGKTVILKPIL